MPRSLKKGPFIDPKLAKKVEALNKVNQKKVIKTWSRSSTITPDFVGHTFAARAAHPAGDQAPLGDHVDLRKHLREPQRVVPDVEDVAEEAMAMMPMVGRLRVLRSWGGVMDMSMDGSPIIDRTPIDGLYLNAGWCYGGFKATPASGWCFAHTIANNEPHKLNAAFHVFCESFVDPFGRQQALVLNECFC